MDIHIFDGQLLRTKTSLSPYLENAFQMSSEEKLKAFERLRSLIQPNVNFEIIVNDFRTGPNYDATNDLYADDILYICAELLSKVPDKECFISVLNQQLSEMSTGMCPQGRTHRLIQVITAFEEFL